MKTVKTQKCENTKMGKHSMQKYENGQNAKMWRRKNVKTVKTQNCENDQN